MQDHNRRRRRIRTWAISVTALVIVVATLLWLRLPHCPSEPLAHYARELRRTIWDGPLLDREIRRMAGADVLDCGHISVGGYFSPNDCVESAARAKRPFKVRWELPATDARVEDGLLGTADGRLFHFQHLEGPHVPDFRRVNWYKCPNPRLRADGITLDLSCP